MISSRSQPDKEKSQRSKALVNTKNHDTNNREELEVKNFKIKFCGGRKDDVAVVGDETKGKECGKVVETSPKKMREKTYETENTNKSCIKKRLKNAMLPMTPAKRVKKELMLTGSKFCNDLGDFLKPIAKQMETPKKKHDVVKTISHKEENKNTLQKVKPEPVDYQESPSTKTLFSAFMTSYEYLLLKWVKLKSNVILLRNNLELWPVFYQSEVGMKDLTQTWQGFARKIGIEIGDKCEFVLQSEPNTKFACSVFKVNVSRN